MDLAHIRNFSIIAHIDHGKSTVADRLLEMTHTISKREMSEQFLDSMDLERERGITIKAHPIRMLYQAGDGGEYELNLLDTPGHVDFSYEVSRSVAASEGALLIVDASQGIQAQTLANVYLAMEHDLTLVPVVNKIDLPGAEPDRVATELCQAFGFKPEEVLRISAKAGIGIKELLEAIVHRVPSPTGDIDAPLRALIFDSKYDPYKGVIISCRVMDGSVKMGGKLRMMASGAVVDPLEIGAFKPGFFPIGFLQTGEVGYIATGLKQLEETRVGDTVTLDARPATEALPGYKPLKPMVFAGLFPVQGTDYLLLREALDKLKLNDAALHFEPESSQALGFGFRCGFLGLLHMEIVQDRLEREYDLDILATAPSVAYRVIGNKGEIIEIDNPAELPDPGQYRGLQEPWVEANIVVPSRFIGAMMDIVSTRRGVFQRMEYLDTRTGQTGQEPTTQEPSQDPRVLLSYQVPMAEILVDFYDQIKSRSQGYASLDYTLLDFRTGALVKLEILINLKAIDSLSLIVHKDVAYHRGKEMVEKLRVLIPRQMFDVPIQAAIGSKVIARETIHAMRKNVIAKCYGGDITRKMKLLHKQAEGKKRMKMVGQVEIPQEAFLAILKLNK